MARDWTAVIIRAVTGFAPPGEGALRAMKVAEHLRSCGHEVQTVRLATPPWESWCAADALPERARELEAAAVATGVQFLSLGPCSAEGVPAVVEALLATQATFCAARLDNGGSAAAAEAMLRLAQADPQHNLRFAALARVEAGTPFFPAAFAQREGFALAMELTPSLLAAGGDVAALAPGLEALERDARAAQMPFLGIDPSLAPGLYGEGSVARLMALRGGGGGGSPGPPAVGGGYCAAGAPRRGAGGVFSRAPPALVGELTAALRALPVEQVGYRGVMFAVMEDPGLVEALRQREFDIGDLLEYASRCGTGLDTVPLPGDVGVDRLAALLDRVAAVANKGAKPLSARLFPAPGIAAGETVATGSPYLFDCPAMELP